MMKASVFGTNYREIIIYSLFDTSGQRTTTNWGMGSATQEFSERE